MNNIYDFATIELAAQDYWAEQQTFKASEDLNREKYYCLSMLPYPSGDLHVGHVRNYTIGDAISRYQRLLGKNVLQPMGWDAFGLPAENAAIKNKTSPAQWTQKNIKRMRKQLQQLGLGIDWQREFATCDPDYYRWEQWLFVQLYKKGLIYKKAAIVNWDPIDKTVLANEQVVAGKGWRSGAEVEQREIQQWFFKITDYADELLSSLDELKDWPEQVIEMQRNWIGRSEGLEIKFKLVKYKGDIEIFTTRADTLMGVTYIGIAPEHPLAKRSAENNPAVAKFIKQCRKVKMSEAALNTQEKLGINSGIKVIHPITQEKLPVWITNFVLMEYGSGAVMAVPAHDQRDFEFAQKYELPITQVIHSQTEWDYNKAAFSDYGTLINSEEFDGLSSEIAIKKIGDFLIKKTLATRKQHYRLRDWGVSRQRYWGVPIPIIYCKHCGPVAVPEDQLPVVLPTDLIPSGQGSPLVDSAEFYKTKCPTCNKAAKRETDTLDTFVESSWYYARYCSFDQTSAMLDDRAKYWTPVDQYIGGIEHAV
ncbi:MAG: leucine--tRNA ligase, partial [Gammaproteobacteria bacterium]|nr:leucine--tRNA ligase [Gammaproteobacteria bacterium]